MKKFFAFSIALLTLAVLAPQAGAATVGLKGGVNFANMAIKTTSVDIPDFNNQTGIVEGIFASFKLGPVSIQPELLYSRRGLTYQEFEDVDVNVTGHFVLDYVELPVLVKYSFLAGPAKPFLYAGPSFSVLLKARQGYSVDYIADVEADYFYLYDMEEYIKKTEFAGVFGAGVDLKLAKVILSLEGRYHLGLGNVAQEEFMGESDITSLKNKGFSVLVGIGF